MNENYQFHVVFRGDGFKRCAHTDELTEVLNKSYIRRNDRRVSLFTLQYIRSRMKHLLIFKLRFFLKAEKETTYQTKKYKR